MSIIEHLYQLEDQDCELLYTGAHAEVRQYRNYRWLNLEGDLIQSLMDIEQPDRLLNPVNIYMLAGMYLRPAPVTVLNLGFGGGVFERYFSRHYPEICIHSVDSDETVIHLAREFFDLDPGYPVYLQSAEAFISAIDEVYDLILCDIFSAERQPECLFTESFYEDCRRCSAATGLLIMNLVPRNQDELVRVLQPLRKIFGHTALLEIPEHSNVIVFASDRELRFAQDDSQEKQPPELTGITRKGFMELLHILPEGQ